MAYLCSEAEVELLRALLLGVGFHVFTCSFLEPKDPPVFVSWQPS